MELLFTIKKDFDIVLCQKVSHGMCSSLIKQHHELLYGPDKYIPKMHFLPEQMIALGPMITWTMRHEAKLNFF